MISWNEEILIPVNIDLIWTLFDIENMQRIMPQVVETKVLEKKEAIIGSTYEQTYQEGKRVQKYIVTDLEHEDTPERKHNKSGFTLAKMFEVEVSYTLIKVNEDETKFLYSGQNKPLNLIARGMVKMMGNKKNNQVVADFIELVKSEAIKDRDGVK